MLLLFHTPSRIGRRCLAVLLAAGSFAWRVHKMSLMAAITWHFQNRSWRPCLAVPPLSQIGPTFYHSRDSTDSISSTIDTDFFFS